MGKQFEGELSRAIDASCPLVHVVTADAPRCEAAICRVLDAADCALVYRVSPLLGLEPVTQAGEDRIGDILGGLDPAMLTDPATILQALAKLPPSRTNDRVILWTGADRAWSDPGLAGALLLVRDRLASRSVTLVGTGDGPVTGTLASHVHTVRDALPDDAERATLARGILDESKVAVTDSEMSTIANYTRGLPPFAVEQVVALASVSGRLEPAQLASRWSDLLGNLPGVTVEQPLPLEAIGGLHAWMAELHDYAFARPSLVVIVDEFEKIMPGSGGANDSGASAAILGAVLSHLGEHKPIAAILQGVPGTGKTLSARCAATIYGCPVITMNPSRFKDSLVGSTEANAAKVLSTFAAFGGNQMWLATSNDLDTVPEEMRDRFRGGVWFSDLPAAADLPAIFEANLARYGLELGGTLPDLAGWSGRDVESACLEARSKNRTVAYEAAKIVPAARKMAARIEKMRAAARTEGYKSMLTGQPYTGPAATSTTAPVGRTLRRKVEPPPAPTATEEEVF